MPNLFRLGDFRLHSGTFSTWKIDCDALTDDDIECLADLGRKLVGTFGQAFGIPEGGNRLAKAMERWADPWSPRILIVDDVLTTGLSMENARQMLPPHAGEAVGLVIFARGPCAPWVKAIFTVNGGE